MHANNKNFSLGLENDRLRVHVYKRATFLKFFIQEYQVNEKEQ